MEMERKHYTGVPVEAINKPSSITKCEECGTPHENNNSKVVESFKIPFKCSTCGSVKFPYQALNGIVYVWPKPIEESVGTIIIPERLRQNLKTNLGVVLSVGSGCLDVRRNVFVESSLKEGDVLKYDKNVPWRDSIEDDTGSEHIVDILNVLDAHSVEKKQYGKK